MPGKVWLGVLGLISACATGLFLYATQHGALITSPDSRIYVAASRSLLAGAGFVETDGDLMTQWAPLYPLLLAGMGAVSGYTTDGRILDVIRLFNALTYGGIMFAAGLLFRRYLASPVMALVGVLAVLSSWALLLISVHAWSEPLFALLCLVFLLVLPHTLDKPTPRGVAVLGVIAALACLQRYTGLFLVVLGGVAMLFLLDNRHTIRGRLSYALGFGVIALLPVSLYMLRNFLLVGKLTGAREMELTLTRTLEQFSNFAELMARWYVADAGSWRWLAPTLLIMAFVGGVWRSIPLRKPVHQTPLLVVLYVAVFSGFFSAAFTFSVVENSERMLTPLIVPVYVLLLLLLERVAVWLNARLQRRYVGYVVVIAALVLWLASHPAQKVYSEVRVLSGWCCTDRNYTDSATINWLRDQSFDGLIWSNESSQVHLHTGLYPRRTPRSADDIGFTELDPTQSNYLIMIDSNPDVSIFASDFQVETLWQSDEDVVYRLTAHEDDTQ